MHNAVVTISNQLPTLNSGSVTIMSAQNISEIQAQIGTRDSSVGIATRYRLDGPGIESRWGGETYRTRPDRP